MLFILSVPLAILFYLQLFTWNIIMSCLGYVLLAVATDTPVDLEI